MIELPRSNFPTEDGMTCIGPHHGKFEFFRISSVGCASHSTKGVLHHILKCTDVTLARSETQFAGQITYYNFA